MKERPSKRYAHGRHIYKLTDHAGIGHEINDEGHIEKKGYERAQDVVGEFFSRPEYRHLNIVRGENREEKKREAKAEAARLNMIAQCDVLFDGAAEIPVGSPNAQRMFLLRKAMAEKIAEKGSPEKVSKDDRQTLALDYLEVLGVVSPEQRHEHQTRRAQEALLATLVNDYGTAAEIIAAPETIASKVLERVRMEKDAADIARRKADEAAHAERLRLDREAAAARATAERESAEALAAERAAIEIQRAQIAEAAAENAKQAGLIQQAWEQLNALGAQIKAAAKLLGLSGNPVVRAGIEAAQRLAGLGRRREDDPR